MLPETTTILIVGGGPSGLSSAISLVNQGCRDIVIVDAVLQGQNTSRAMAIHAATLEVSSCYSLPCTTLRNIFQSLDTVACADPLIQLGIQGKGLGMHNRSSPLLSVNFSSLSPYTRFPYVLILPQYVTERVLVEHLEGLGVRVLRPYKVVGLKTNDNEAGLHVSFESGEVIKASYVIGADGARSAVIS
jgi:2-polyprenyl-6-methoxyphenol hydroxylase-like FAD-dependent oxidoreductase